MANRLIAFPNVDNIFVLVAEINGMSEFLTEEEIPAAANFSISRRKEFAAGRNLAREAFTNFGLRDVSIPVASHRYPVWPSGFVGSISHTSQFAGVAVASQSHFRSVGLDLESTGAVKHDLFPTIMSGSEIELITQKHDQDLATVLFSCKEAVFKAVFPIFEEYIDFLEVQISLGIGTFEATCNDGRRSASSINRGIGFFERSSKTTKTLFLVDNYDDA